MYDRPTAPSPRALGVAGAVGGVTGGAAAFVSRRRVAARLAARRGDVDLSEAREALEQATDRQEAPAPLVPSAPEQQLEETRGLRHDIAALVVAMQALLSHTETSSRAQGTANRRILTLTFMGVLLMAATLYVAIVVAPR